ncbi:GNAT family N-acetyltransferase [Promicromonospora iranensis]|uniref:Acetyltransferase n=1 Tax=Promicromonospora iranensis TaxID=1105144 RepID=A0ABU2CJG3_9MICO|nr:GNAT family N-acetyltransferase [Promicromonospora iranensis]MDR7381484.1 putative acetyltransferase [Promicromonospora iranensis]
MSTAAVPPAAWAEPAVVRRLGRDCPAGLGLSALLTAYHLRTEAEKGTPVTGADALPARYRAETTDPRRAFAEDVVLVARCGDVSAGCLVLTAPVSGRSEIKRLWTEPEARGRGIASMLVETALTAAHEGDVSTVALSVWSWRAGAIRLYETLGFAVVDSWDERDDLVCLERAVLPAGTH